MVKAQFAKIREGSTEIKVPDLEYYRQFAKDPSFEAPVFYNPKMEFSRDVSVCMISSYQKLNHYKLRIADPLAGTGIRGIRYANEIENVEKVWVNDLDEFSVKVIKENVKSNKLNNVEVSNKDANLFLDEHQHDKFNVIDLDPFGTAMPFLDSAIRSLYLHGGFITLTATDTSALCGAFPESCMRRYFAVPAHNEHMKEIGARILVGAMIRQFAVYERTFEPVFTQSSDHYFKVFGVVKPSPSIVKKNLSQIGFIKYCKCGYFDESKFELTESNCPVCKKKMQVAGPLWLGELHSKEYLEEALDFAKKSELGTQKRVIKLFETVIGEVGFPVLFYDTDRFSKRLKNPPKKLETTMNNLKKKGYKVAKTHFVPTAFKTAAPFKEVLKEIKKK
ncbi:MAG: tRNA (guanine(10)-N(2))-dimethyltransferase [Candidatus Diapherotrites archaeon]|nr:tRNA (guanine(10)-N(2))-dimethyltransferase [Candidatus Diapherotrites archaeon]